MRHETEKKDIIIGLTRKAQKEKERERRKGFRTQGAKANLLFKVKMTSLSRFR